VRSTCLRAATPACACEHARRQAQAGPKGLGRQKTPGVFFAVRPLTLSPIPKAVPLSCGMPNDRGPCSFLPAGSQTSAMYGIILVLGYAAEIRRAIGRR